MVSSSLNSPSLGDGHRERDPDPDRLDAVVDPVKEQIEPPRAEAFGLEHFAEPAGELARGALREGGVRCLDKLSEFLSFAVVMRILIFHGYLLRGTGSNIYNANLARALAGLGHEVHLFCQDRSAQEPEGVTIHVPDIGRVLPVYVSDRYEGFDAVPFPELDDEALGHYLDANVVAVRSVPSPEIALANHLVMGPVILARGLEGRAPYAVKIHGSALEYTVRPHRERFLPYAREGIIGASGVLVGSRHTAESLWEVFSDEPSLPERTRLGPPGVNVSSSALAGTRRPLSA
jgi:glycosyltransferase involved in cell wall biosynthesis